MWLMESEAQCREECRSWQTDHGFNRAAVMRSVWVTQRKASDRRSSSLCSGRPSRHSPPATLCPPPRARAACPLLTCADLPEKPWSCAAPPCCYESGLHFLNWGRICRESWIDKHPGWRRWTGPSLCCIGPVCCRWPLGNGWFSLRRGCTRPGGRRRQSLTVKHCWEELVVGLFWCLMLMDLQRNKSIDYSAYLVKYMYDLLLCYELSRGELKHCPCIQNLYLITLSRYLSIAFVYYLILFKMFE